MQIRHRSSGVADGTSDDNGRINGGIHSADLEHVPVNRYDADSRSWINGDNPVK
jgi:hypothetical protein